MPRRRLAVVFVALLLGLGMPPGRHLPRASAGTLPTTLSDADFWQIATDFSEPNGYFRSENLLSNERAFQRVLPRLTTRLATGGVYLGVGPEQNFTYLAALRPTLAFIVDIRRGNLVEQLFYKTLFELSPDRSAFVKRLFARDMPALRRDARVDELFAACARATPSEALFSQYLADAKTRLVETHHFALTEEDLAGIGHVYAAFFTAGPDLSYSFLNGSFGRGRFGGGFFPTYADLMQETDGLGAHRAYLASDEAYQTVRQLELNNAVIPIVGDFGGPKALRSVGRFVAERGATITAFYTSNVEQYLFQDNGWRRFYGNVATLPYDTSSTFIRSVSGRGYQVQTAGPRASTRLSTIAEVVDGFHSGRVRSYADVIAMSY